MSAQRPGAVSRERLARAFDAAGWYPTGTGDRWSAVEVYSRDSRADGVRGICQIYRDRRGRVTGATLFDDDGRAYPFGSRAVVGALRDYLAGVRYDVTTYNGAHPAGFGRPFGPSSVMRFPTKPAALAYRRRVERDRSVSMLRVDPTS